MQISINAEGIVLSTVGSPARDQGSRRRGHEGRRIRRALALHNRRAKCYPYEPKRGGMMSATLTIDDVIKLTGLSRNTIQVYASQQKLGTKVGNKRLFTPAEAKKLGGSAKAAKGTGKGPAKKTPIAKAKKPARKKSPSTPAKPKKAKAKQAVAPVQKKTEQANDVQRVQKRSFFSFLGFGAKAQPRNAKLTKMTDLIKK
jgi:DNA-binding transcriptional MerR regulator